MSSLRACWLLAWLSGACSVTALAEREQPIAINSCERDSDCRLATCVQNQCFSPSSSFSTLLFAVSPPVTGEYAPSQLFSVRTDVPAQGSLPPHGRPYRLAFPAPTNLSARVVATAAIPAGCAPLFVGRQGSGSFAVAADGSIPVRMSFLPVERLLGLPSDSSTFHSDEPLGALPASYDLQARLPPGRYDIFVEPYALTPSTMKSGGVDCRLPPFVLRNQQLSSGEVRLPIELPTPSELVLSVDTPASLVSLVKWTVQVLEPRAGRPLSNPVELGPKLGNAYVATLRYLPIANGAEEDVGAELVKLMAPTEVIAPALIYERKSLELFTPGLATIDQLTRLPKTVTLSGSVQDAFTHEPVKAAVSVLATELRGMDQLPVSFTRQASTAEDGSFRLELLPGTYEVRATPQSNLPYGEAPYATVSATWEVAESPSTQAGRSLLVGRTGAVKGVVLVPNANAGAQGAVVVANASPASVVSDAYSKARIRLPHAPAASGSVVDEDGSFQLFAEPGTFDVFVRPPLESGFPWLVIPGLDLTKPRPAETGLEQQLLQHPVRLDVQAALDVEQENPLVGAEIRVFALLDGKGAPVENPDEARSAVPIAQGRLDSTGFGRLLLPKTLNPITLP